MMPAIQERQYPRQLIRPRLYVALNGSSSGGILNDVSEGGMSLDILGPKPAGEDVLLNFDLPEIGQHFEGKGKIAWSTQDGNENRVGLKFVELSENSHWQIKKWLSHKASTAEAAQNVMVQDWARDGGPVSYSAQTNSVPAHPRTTTVPLIEPPVAPRAPVSARPAQPLAPTSALPATRANPAAGRTEAIAANVPPAAPKATSPAPKALEAKPVIAPGVVALPQRAAGTLTDDQLIAGLRSTFTQADLSGDGPIRDKNVKAEAPGSIEKDPEPFNREVFQSWVTGAIVVFVLIVATAAAKWIYTSPALDKVTSMEDVKRLVEEKLNLTKASVPPTEAAVDAGPKTAKAGKAVRRDLKNVAHGGGASPRTESPNTSTPQFQVANAQNGRTGVVEKTLAPPPAALTPTGTTIAQVSGGTSGTGATAPVLGGTKVGMVSVQPSRDVPVEKVIPEYPTLALEKNVQGRVVIRATIGKDGALQGVRLAGAPSLLSDAVLEAVRKWHYQPRLQGGVLVEVDTQITIDFEINAR